MNWRNTFLVLLLAATTSARAFNLFGDTPSSVAAHVKRNVVFSEAGGVKLTMDIYLPRVTNSPALPVVVYVHGGGWRMGDKSMLAMMAGPMELLRRGYVVVAFDYRLAPDFKFPAMLEDSKCAIRYLRAHAKEFNLDPAHIGVMGDSAGGHLAELLGLTDARAGFEGKGWTNESSRVEAVVDLYGPSDFTLGPTNLNTMAGRMFMQAFGPTNATDSIIRRASPASYVSSNAPPFLIFHGNKDGLVNIEQSRLLFERLRAAGDDAQFVVITNYAHGRAAFGFGTVHPNDAERAKLIADFYDRHLR
ncbi:MAG TPA: alpha/beta hydrolase [Candidatus Sulfotelmatobacter sp.]|jgi:acetyl esterase/lipase|nr:alpha/beta hydrolase [Candidatus Sulfotelmatobacter sp.]